MNQKKTMKRKSFTMIEIVVVIVILVALASIATPLYLNHVKKANIGTAKTQIKLLEDALSGYKLDMIRSQQMARELCGAQRHVSMDIHIDICSDHDLDNCRCWFPILERRKCRSGRGSEERVT